MKKYYMLTTVLGVIFAFVFMSKVSFAKETFDERREVSLTLVYENENFVGIPNAKFDIFCVGNIDKYGDLIISEDFAKAESETYFGIRDFWEGLKDGKTDPAVLTEAIKGYSLSLKSYIYANGITPMDTGKTDDKGRLAFPGKNVMYKGLYFVDGHRLVSEDHYIYEPAPMLIVLPAYSNENKWEYDVTANIKYEKTEENTENDKVKIKVIKLWDDLGEESKRPAKVSIILLRNGGKFDTIELSKENNWRFAWKELNAFDKEGKPYEYLVHEKTIEGYRYKLEKRGNTYLITNELKDTAGKPGTGKPDIDGTGNKLPQTGMLWWPVPLMLAGGLLAIIVGMMRRRKDDKKK